MKPTPAERVALDLATAHIRHALIDADRTLAKAEDSAFSLV